MKPFRRRKALAAATICAAALVLIGCSSPASTGDAPEPPTASDDATAGESAGCPPEEMDDIVSAGGEVEIERVAPADYIVPGLDEALLAEACLYDTTNQGKTAQWAWFRGDDATVVAAAISDALAAAGYTLEEDTGSAQLYSSESDPSVTVSTTGSAGAAAATGAQAIFDLLGPNVSVFQYYS